MMIVKGVAVSETEVHTISADGCGSFPVVVKGGKLKVGETVQLEVVNPKVVKLIDKK